MEAPAGLSRLSWGFSPYEAGDERSAIGWPIFAQFGFVYTKIHLSFICAKEVLLLYCD
jgi:hypothetical protein